jgi:choline dehydrogenase-like flavoprotein
MLFNEMVSSSFTWCRHCWKELAMEQQTYDHAIVIGGGIAGMVAAHVLADHFERVTLLERDTFPTAADFRKGVPQGRHSHIILKRGEIILEQLFPGIVAELEANGALQVNYGSDLRWPETEGGEPPTDPASMLTGNYIGQVMVAATRNPVVLDALYRVQNMIETPDIFFRPDIVVQSSPC